MPAHSILEPRNQPAPAPFDICAERARAGPA